MMTVTNSDAGSGLQSVDRALHVLELLAGWGTGGVSELATEIGVHKSTAFRLLGALEAREMVQQDTERGKYRLGFGLVRLARSVNVQLELTEQARPLTDELARTLGESINVAVLREHFAVNVVQSWGQASVASQNWIGQLTPLHATSSGKVLLAHLDKCGPGRTGRTRARSLHPEHPHRSRGPEERAAKRPRARPRGHLRRARTRPERGRRPGPRRGRPRLRRVERIGTGLPSQS